MTLTMCCKVVFHRMDRRDEIVINPVNAIEFESGFRQLTDRGSVTLPRNVKFFDKLKVREVFRRGDPITIYMGYDGKLIQEFSGYVLEVSADIPIVIRFEDEMFNVKRIPVNFSHPNISLDQLLKAIIPGYEIEAQEGVQLGSVRMPQTQVGPVLEKIQQDWQLYTYMKGKKVVCGKYYADDSNLEIIDFHLERDCVSTSLNYKKKEDIELQVTVVSTLRNGSKVEVKGIGDSQGDFVQLTEYGISDTTVLRLRGQQYYERFKQDRFDGNYTAFGIPSVKHGMKVRLKSSLYEDRSGTYYIEKVTKSFSAEGYRQEITLGDKIT